MINVNNFITSKVYAKTFHIKLQKTTTGEDEVGGGEREGEEKILKMGSIEYFNL